MHCPDREREREIQVSLRDALRVSQETETNANLNHLVIVKRLC